MTPCTIQATRQYLHVGGLRLSYLEWSGDGPPLLLLHGVTSSASTFWQLAPALAAQGYRVFALDMPGHGESDGSPEHQIDSIAGLVSELILALNLREVTLIGHSWGGTTALALASGEHPAREVIARVALLDPILGMSAERGRKMLPFYIEGVGQPISANEKLLRARNPGWRECDFIWKLDALARCRVEQVEGFFVGIGTWRLTRRIEDVEVPLLLLLANPQYSIISLEQRAEARVKLRPGTGEMQIILGATHTMFRGRGYAPTAQALMDWLGYGKVKGEISLP